MRALALIALAAVLAIPSLADGRDHGKRAAPGRRSASGPRAAASPAPAAPPRVGTAPAPAPAPGYRVAPAPAPGYRVAPAPAPGYQVAPAPAPGDARRTPRYRYGPAGPVAVYPVYPVTPYWWWGWGWGFGYYPLYPRPPVAEYGPVEPVRVTTAVSARVAATREGAAAGVALAIEGRRAGFDATVDALALDQIGGGHSLGSSSAIGLGSMHATWSLVSAQSARVRLELGGSMLSMPTGGAVAGAPWEGKVAFGPDVGLSGQLGLVGPLGLEGHARVTPVPVPVTDLRAGLALRAGTLAVTGGWRAIRVAGDGVDAPSLTFSGPEIGLALVF